MPILFNLLSEGGGVRNEKYYIIGNLGCFAIPIAKSIRNKNEKKN